MIKLTIYKKISGRPIGKLHTFNDLEQMIFYLKENAPSSRTAAQFKDSDTMKRQTWNFIPVDLDGETRSDKNVQGGTTIVVLDIDNKDGIELTMAMLKRKLDYRAVIATTASHSTSGVDKYRVFIPISRELTGLEIKRGIVYEIAESVGFPMKFRNSIDPVCKKISQAYLMPFDDAEWYDIPGEIFSVSDLTPQQASAHQPPQTKKKKSKHSIGMAMEAYGVSDYSLLDMVTLFEDQGLNPKQAVDDEDKFTSDCPWHDEHSDGRGGAFFRLLKGRPPFFKCLHSSCEDRSMVDVINKFNGCKEYIEETFDLDADPNVDEDLLSYFAGIMDCSKYPETQSEALARYIILHDIRGKMYDLATKKILSTSEVVTGIGSKVKDFSGDKAKAWSISNDFRSRRINSKNIIFDPSRSVRYPKLNLFDGLSFPSIDKPLQYQIDKCRAVVTDCLTLICAQNVEQARWLLQWLAHPLQNNHVKMMTAVILISNKTGLGKSVIFNKVMASVYGYHYKSLASHDIDSQFNNWIQHTLFACADDLVSTKDALYRISGPLRSLITETTARHEAKGRDSQTVGNYCNFTFTSNDKLPLLIEPNDRRFFVSGTDTNDRLSAKEYAYLHEELPQLPHVMHSMLMAVETPKDMHSFHAPDTEMRDRLINQSIGSSAGFLRDFVAGALGIFPFNPIVARMLHKVYVAWCGDNKKGAASLSTLKEEMLRFDFRHKRTSNYEGYILINGEKSQACTTQAFKTEARAYIDLVEDRRNDDEIVPVKLDFCA